MGNPWLLIEFSHVGEESLLELAHRRDFDDDCIQRIKHDHICEERYSLSSPNIYLIEPSPWQFYCAKNLKHGHCQIRGAEIPELLKRVNHANRHSKSEQTKVTRIRRYVRKFEDDFITVVNQPPKRTTDLLDWNTIASKLQFCDKDENRNNKSIDLGHCGSRNQSRQPRHLGLTVSNRFKWTMEPWSKAIFVGMTEVIDLVMPNAKDTIYPDPERNSFWSNEIHEKNRCEALRLGRTNEDTELLAYHRDVGNCDTEGYAYVATISRCHIDQKSGLPVRDAVTVYGKKVADKYMAKRKKHRVTIECVKRFWETKVPQFVKSQGSEVFVDASRSPMLRAAYDFSFADKIIYYSLFASAIELLCQTYACLRNNLGIVAALLTCVVMSESPDHFWHIMQDLIKSPRAFTDTPFYAMNEYDFAYELAVEFFKRKKHSGNDTTEKPVTYPVHRKHIPAVNTPPSFDSMKRGVDAVIVLVKECRILPDVHTTNIYSYYGRAVDFLAEHCHGGGHLTAMHIIGVAACLKILPPSFVNVAEVGVSTRTWEFLKWAFGYIDETVHKDMRDLLRALAVLLDITVRQAEELLCLFARGNSPHSTQIMRQPCEINFDNPELPLQFRSSNGFGDVVYARMFVYNFTDGQDMYFIDCDGKWLKYDGLLRESLFDAVIYHAVDDFWTRKGSRPYAPRRSSVHPKIQTVQTYFWQRGETKQMVMNRVWRILGHRLYEHHFHGHWFLKGQYAADVVALNLLGPSYESVLLQPSAREPLELHRIIHTALFGPGNFQRTLLNVHAIRNQRRYRVPCVARKYRYFGGNKTFYACSLNIPKDIKSWEINNGTTYEYFPDPYFDMYTCDRNESLILAPSEWQPKLTDFRQEDRTALRHVKFEQRFELPMPWNSSRIRPSSDYRGEIRYFENREDAEYFALMDFAVKHLHLLPWTDKQVQRLFFEPTPGKKCASRILVDKTEDVRVFYDSRNGSKLKKPFLIAVLYPKGGSAYYFCNEAGQRRSGAFLRRPNALCRIRNSPGIKYEFISIVRHVIGDERSVRYRGSPVNLVVHWKGGCKTEEPMTSIFEDAPMDVVNYAYENRLLAEPSWHHVRRLYESMERKKRTSLPANLQYGFIRAKRKCEQDQLSDGEIEESTGKIYFQKRNQKKKP